MKKNIVFITNYFGNGGAARVMKVLSSTLVNKGYEVKIISFIDDENKYEIPQRIKYETINSDSKNKIIKKIKRIIELRNKIKLNGRCTIIAFEYFVNMEVIISNIFLKNKLIISERNDPKREGNRVKNIRNFLYRFASCLVCQTEEAKRYFPKYIQKKSVIIVNPIKNDLPEPYFGERTKEIVSFSRIEKQKNIPMMIDAFEIFSKKYSDYKLIIYGDGKEKENIDKYIHDKHIEDKVSLKGFENNIHEKILKCRMFISTSNYEGISNSMIESMGIGLPTIVTDCPCGGAKMMIKDHENGLLVPVGSAKKMAEAMTEIIENKKLEKKITKNAIKIREKLNESKICEEWEKMI